MEAVIAVSVGYVAGSIPFAYLLTRGHGIDLRRVGSGNVGASNVLRTSGVPAALAAMCLDALKGSAAVLAAQSFGSAPATIVAAGVASVIGHVYPVWLGFRGGKGVATAAGAFAMLAPAAVAIAVLVFLAAVLATRYVSAGSLAASVTLAAATPASGASTPVIAGAAVTALLIVLRHRANLQRLATGTERRLGQRLF